MALLLSLGQAAGPAQAQNTVYSVFPNALQQIGAKRSPVLIKGISTRPRSPLELDFIMTPGQGRESVGIPKPDAERLTRYFLAALTVPEQDLWVNLSPYEKDRIVPAAFGQTEMGQDLLAQDYVLKQMTASVIYPESEMGRIFWGKVYAEAERRFGSTDIPLETLSKVWIVPAEAKLYEAGENKTVYVIKARLKVMMESDYLASKEKKSAAGNSSGNWANDVMRQVVIPVLEREVNEGESFAVLRQIYQAVVLAGWFKEKLRNGTLALTYADQNKVIGIVSPQEQAVENIYEQYVQAFRQGAYSFIKEEMSSSTGETVPRKYFSGGARLQTSNVRQVSASLAADDQAQLGKVLSGAFTVKVRLAAVGQQRDSAQILSEGRTFLSLLDLQGISLEDREKMVLVAQRVIREFGRRYYSDFEHGVMHAVSVFKTVKDLAEKKGWMSEINWPLMLAEVMLHDVNAAEVKNHSPAAAKTAVIVLKKMFDLKDRTRLKQGILLHDNYTFEGAEERKLAGVEAQLLFWADVIDAFGVKGVYRYLATYIKREAKARGHDLALQEIVDLAREGIMANAQSRFMTVDDADVKEMARPLFDQLISFMQRFISEEPADDPLIGSRGVVWAINENLTARPWKIAADHVDKLMKSPKPAAKENAKDHQYALDYFSSLAAEYPSAYTLPYLSNDMRIADWIAFDWQLNEMLLTDQPLRSQMSKWSGTQLGRLASLIEEIVRGVVWSGDTEEFAALLVTVKARLKEVTADPRHDPDKIMGYWSELARSAFLQARDGWKLHVFHVASMQAAKVFIQEAGLGRDNTTIVFTNEVTYQMAGEWFPGYKIEREGYENLLYGGHVRFDGHGKVFINSKPQGVTASLPLIPLKFNITRRSESEAKALRQMAGISPERPVIVVGSPQAWEFVRFMQDYNALYQGVPKAQRPLVIVGFRSVDFEHEIEDEPYMQGNSAVIRRTREVWPGLGDNNILVLNTQGELPKMYSIANVALVGEDHNLIEPACMSAAILYFGGDWFFNNESLRRLEQNNAGVQYGPAELKHLLDEPNAAALMGQRAEEVAQSYREEISAKVRETALLLVGASWHVRQKWLLSLQEPLDNRDFAQNGPADYGGVDLTAAQAQTVVRSNRGADEIAPEPGMGDQKHFSSGFRPEILAIIPLSLSR